MNSSFLLQEKAFLKFEQFKFLFVIGLLMSSSIISAQTKYKFTRPNLNEHLSHNSVQSIFQDSYGFLWFGTDGGLNKFDGYNIIEYVHDLDDSTSISNNHVLSIYEDIDNTGKILWLGTKDGLVKFDRFTEKFQTYKSNKTDSESQQQNLIKYICDDNKGSLWLGGNGLKKFEKKTGRIIQFLQNFNSLFIYSISIDDKNLLWLGTTEGLIKFNPGNKKYNQYKFNTDNPHDVNRNTISAHMPDSNRIWIGTYEGIYEFNIKTEKFSRPNFLIGNPDFSLVNEIKKDQLDNIWIANGSLYKLTLSRDSLLEYSHGLSVDAYSSTRLNSICIDASGIIWIGLIKKGVIKGNPIRKNFNHFNYDPQNSMSLNFNDVTSFMEDDMGFMWIGASLGGLNKFNKKTKKFYVAGGSPVALNITKDSYGVLWYSSIGCMVAYNPFNNEGGAYFGKGILEDNAGACIIYDDQQKNVEQREFLFKRAVKRNLVQMRDAGNGIFHCFIDSEDSIWVLTGPGRKINKFDLKKRIYTPYTLKTDEDISNSVQFIFEDRNNNLWFGTNGKGLVKRIRVNDTKVEFIHYKKTNNKNSISSNIINTICEDENGFLWIGTDLGLNKFDQTNNSFKKFTVNDGLPSNLIAALVNDNFGKIWISSNKGLSKFDPTTVTFTNYDKSYGLQSNTFNLRSCYKDSEGYLYFGGSNGFNMFKPEDINENPNLPRTYITDIQIYNQSLNIEKDSPLKKEIAFTEEITLNHDQNVITFEFSALEFTNSGNNDYKYMMEGIDPDWIKTKADRRFASYTQLNPGEYKFKVRGSNDDKVWGANETSLIITVLPPWWQTNFAYFIYIVFSIVVIYLIWKFQVNQLKLKHQAEIEHLQSEKFREMDRLKSRFFANISHEFRTPLTLIIGPIKQIIEIEKNNKTKEKLNLVFKSANKLLGLVNQLLDLSKLEAGKLSLQVKEKDLIPLVKGMVLSFVSLAGTKNISINFNALAKELPIFIDEEKLSKIINNLLSNAIKFSNDGGIINVDISRKNNLAEIRISDTGIGIPAERLNKIFDHFYQVDSSKTREYEGTGIGLALTKELVELHHGTINVMSIENIGSTFTVQFKVGKEHFVQEELEADFIEEVKKDIYKQDFTLAKKSKICDDKISIEAIMNPGKTFILIVEDNEDVRNYIIGYLKNDYTILEAANGEEGLIKSFKYIPDLIISDVMMPKMDGFELLDKLKTDEKTNHIPIILLTAKASDKDKIEGLKIGADDYMMKPFDAEELQVRISNLIEQRKRIRKHFKNQGIVNLSDENILSVDKIFLQKAIKIVEKNIADSKFGVEKFSDEMVMSRQQLRRKFISIIGESPSDFIRKIRLTKASNLIEQNFGNISEIAYEVGFENPAYFAQSFKKYFGYSPSKLEIRK